MDNDDESLFVRTKDKYHEIINDGHDLVEFVDIDHDDDDNDNWVGDLTQKQQNGQQSSTIPTEPITVPIALKLKQILLGKGTQTIPEEWSGQQFEFRDDPPMWYGLVQHRGGPCGVLASVQAFVLAEIFHRNPKKSPNDRTECLAGALAEILWQISHRPRLAIVDPYHRRSIDDESPDFRFDGITECLRITPEIESKSKLERFLLDVLRDQNQFGCVPFVYSCILTRGLDRITDDYDPGSIGSLITPQTWLCTQELVNLCLVGQAVSNVFDNKIEFDQITLRGIERKSTIGFLTWHEYQGGSSVGSNFKNPKLPIFVVLSEGHFTVIFSKTNILENNNNKIIKLFHYDGMAGAQDQEIEWTIETECQDDEPSADHRTPLECIIRLKWPRCRIQE